MDYLEKTKEILGDFLVIDETDIHLDSQLMESLGVDSLDIVEITMEFEEAFNIEVSDAEAEACRTVEDIVNLLKSKKPGQLLP